MWSPTSSSSRCRHQNRGALPGRAGTRPPRCTRPAGLVRDIPLRRPTTLIWLQRRFECDNCGERHTEDHPEIEGKLTRGLARQLVRDSRYLAIRELSRRHRLSWHLIMGLVRVLVGPGGRAPPGRALSHPVGGRDLPATAPPLRHGAAQLRERRGVGHGQAPKRPCPIWVSGQAGPSLVSGRGRCGPDGSESYRAAIKSTWAMPPTCWTDFTWCAGSPPGWWPCAGASSAESLGTCDARLRT